MANQRKRDFQGNTTKFFSPKICRKISNIMSTLMKTSFYYILNTWDIVVLLNKNFLLFVQNGIGSQLLDGNHDKDDEQDSLQGVSNPSSPLYSFGSEFLSLYNNNNSYTQHFNTIISAMLQSSNMTTPFNSMQLRNFLPLYFPQQPNGNSASPFMLPQPFRQNLDPASFFKSKFSKND